MKIRTGFVSNSSSSSFVMIGCEITKQELTAFKEKLLGRTQQNNNDYKWEDDAYNAIDRAGWLYNYESNTIGKLIAYASDYELPEMQKSISELQELSNKVKEAFGKEGKLITGQKQC